MFRKLEPKQHFTEPPPRYTEAALVKALEDNGIGGPRPTPRSSKRSRRAGTSTQAERRFVSHPDRHCGQRFARRALPEDRQPHFTAGMEGDLDRVAEGHEDWIGLLSRFYGPFESELDAAQKKLPRLELRDEPTDEICPNCGRPMVIKHGRFGSFISFSGYPECKTTKPIVKDTGATCPTAAARSWSAARRRAERFTAAATIQSATFLVGCRRHRALPGLRLACAGEDAARRERGVPMRCRPHARRRELSRTADRPERRRTG